MDHGSTRAARRTGVVLLTVALIASAATAGTAVAGRDTAARPGSAVADVTPGSTASEIAVRIADVTLDPSVVDDDQTVTHTLRLEIGGVSDDGNTDTFAIEFPSVVGSISLNGVRVEDGDGDPVLITGTDTSGNSFTFSVSPDSSEDARSLTVTMSIDATYPEVDADATTEVTASVDDSAYGSDSVGIGLTVKDSGDGGDEPLALPLGSVDEFDDGTYADRWRVRNADDETIRERDGYLRHQSPKNYNGGGSMRTEARYVGDGTVRFDVRQQEVSDPYWGTGFGLRFNDTRVILQEQKWGANDRLYLHTGDEEVRLADATDTTRWRTYSLTVDFETMTVTSVTRGDDTYDVDLDVPADAGDPFRLTLGAGRGHDTRYDFVRVTEPDRSDGSDCPTVDGTRTTDPDGDGLCEDVNGNERLDFDDANTLFDNFTNADVTSNVEAFDFNGNDRLDYADVNALFDEVS